MLSPTRIKAASILFAQGVGILTNMLFILFLPDDELYVVVGIMALSGLTSSAAVSNNTAKIYGKISTGEDIQKISRTALCLFGFEQLLAIFFILVLLTFGQTWAVDLTTIELALLVLVSCAGALVAFVRAKDKYFVLFNIIRSVSSLFRLAVVFLLITINAEEWIPLAIIVSLTFPMAAALLFTLKVGPPLSLDENRPLSKTYKLLHEYAWGIPVALSRSFINQGLILAAVELLNPDELRMFRFLLLPKDIIGRAFNAFLPLVFDRMMKYSIRLVPSIGVAAFAVAVAIIWYAIGNSLFSFGWSAATSFVIFLVLNFTVYSVLPIAWRNIHREKARDIAIVVLISTGMTALVFWATAPDSINLILIVMSVFSFCYIAGMLIVSRKQFRHPDISK